MIRQRSLSYLLALALLGALPACNQGDTQSGAQGGGTAQTSAQADQSEAADQEHPADEHGGSGHGEAMEQTAAEEAVTEESGNPLMKPNSKELNMQAPATFKAKFETSKGSFVISVTRDWAPIGADRFFNLVRNGFYDDQRFFRVVPGFVVQWGIHGDPQISRFWDDATIKDDPVKASNKRGFITYAKTGMPNSRSTQLFINFGDNARLDTMGFAPFGQVTEGMEIVEKLYSGYQEQPTSLQGEMVAKGNAFLAEKFPNLDYIKKASIIE